MLRGWAGIGGWVWCRATDRVAPLCVLGPIALHVDGERVAVGGPIPRRLLAALLVNRNAVVSADRLVEVLWGDDPPDTAMPSLQTYASRLRRLLPDLGPAGEQSARVLPAAQPG